MFRKRIATLLLLGVASAFCSDLFYPSTVCHGQEATLADRFNSVDDFHRALSQVRKGDSQEQVKELLGSPGGLHPIKPANKRPTTWYYCTHCFDGKIHRQATHRVCCVDFDKDAKVTRVRKSYDKPFRKIQVFPAKQLLTGEFSNNQAEELVKKLKSYTVSLDEDVLQEQLQQVITQNLNESQKDKAKQLTQQVWPKTKAALEKCVSQFNSISGPSGAAALKPLSGDKGDRPRQRRDSLRFLHLRQNDVKIGVTGTFQHCGAEPQGYWIDVWRNPSTFGFSSSVELANFFGRKAWMNSSGPSSGHPVQHDESLIAPKQSFKIDLKPYGVDKQFNWELPISVRLTIVGHVVCEAPKVTATKTKPDIEVTLKPEFYVTATRTIKIPKGFNVKTSGGEKDTVTGTYGIPEIKVRLKADLKDEKTFQRP